ncbi:uncharacterized protein LOC119594716 [Penaeus monodon]|uniref:uncharacterized protein LOC119594716 n=1 Tax=Penaeus monodon TaxID=6687 RepID=UPI0018A7A7E0|nr:uncharacterized protein LOC119594716 [Penaeus monodon]
MGGGRLKAALFLVSCAATSLTWAQYEQGIPLCKDVRQQGNSTDEWVPIGSSGNIRQDCQLQNQFDQCRGDMTLFENELNNLKRCQNYSAKREACVIVKRSNHDNVVHMLVLLLDVICSDGDQHPVDSCLMCFFSVPEDMAMQASSAVSVAKTFMPETVTSQTLEPRQQSVQWQKNDWGKYIFGIFTVLSVVMNVILAMKLCKRSDCKKLPCIENPESGGYRRCSTVDSHTNMTELT